MECKWWLHSHSLYSSSSKAHCKPMSYYENRISLCPYSHREKLLLLQGIIFWLQGFPCLPPVLPCRNCSAASLQTMRKVFSAFLTFLSLTLLKNQLYANKSHSSVNCLVFAVVSFFYFLFPDIKNKNGQKKLGWKGFHSHKLPNDDNTWCLPDNCLMDVAAWFGKSNWGIRNNSLSA